MTFSSPTMQQYATSHCSSRISKASPPQHFSCPLRPSFSSEIFSQAMISVRGLNFREWQGAVPSPMESELIDIAAKRIPSLPVR
ncbi:hypothetical protein ACFX1Z_006615 [Malus domestica]